MIVLHVFGSASETALRAALADTYRITVRRKPALVVELVARGMVDAVVTELVRSDGSSVFPMIQQVRDVSRTMPILGYVPDGGEAQSIMLLPRAVYVGLSGGISCKGDEILSVVSAALAPPFNQSFGVLFQEAIDALPIGVAKAFCVCLLTRRNFAAVTYADLVAEAGATPAMLSGAFRKFGLGGPQRLFLRIRLLAAMALLVTERRRTESIAPAFGFRSGDALRGALARETGHRARMGYDAGDYDRIVRNIREQLQGRYDRQSNHE